MDSEAFSELSGVVTEGVLSISELRSYVVGDPTIQGNRADVPVELDYVDGYGQTHRETVHFITVARGAVWRVSLLQSMPGGGPAYEYEPPDVSIPFSSGGG